jgi:DNA invertase Pin-like site-specific DNA recombinase
VKAIGYVRCSTLEQGNSGAGLAAQRQAIVQACEQRGYDLVCPHSSAPLCSRGIYGDAGFSAKNLKRPAIAAALEALDAGKADALVVAKLDRLSRSLLDFAGLVERSRRKGWAIIALDLGVDTTTPSGEMMANVLATFAQFERRLIGQRTKDALAVKKAQGVRLGRPRALPPRLVHRVVKMREDGATLDAIAEALNAEGVPTAHGGARWYGSTVRAVLAYGERSEQ